LPVSTKAQLLQLAFVLGGVAIASPNSTETFLSSQTSLVGRSPLPLHKARSLVSRTFLRALPAFGQLFKQINDGKV
jgi:hypothetical protein